MKEDEERHRAGKRKKMKLYDFNLTLSRNMFECVCLCYGEVECLYGDAMDVSQLFRKYCNFLVFTSNTVQTFLLH